MIISIVMEEQLDSISLSITMDKEISNQGLIG